MSLINTKTNLFTSNGHIGIYTFYQKCVNYINFWINGVPEKIDGVNFIEGQLGYKVDGYNDKFFLNGKGELIVNSDDPNKYAIDMEGNLTSTKDFCSVLVPDPLINVNISYGIVVSGVTTDFSDTGDNAYNALQTWIDHLGDSTVNLQGLGVKATAMTIGSTFTYFDGSLVNTGYYLIDFSTRAQPVYHIVDGILTQILTWG